VAPHLRALIRQRLANIDEKLTRSMIATDGASAAASAASREAKRTLISRLDGLCARVAVLQAKVGAN
jgi:hypothetical protein